MDSLTFNRLSLLAAYYALDFPRPAYDYNGAGNMITYDDYVKNDYAIDVHRNEGHNREGYYMDGVDIYASWRLW